MPKFSEILPSIIYWFLPLAFYLSSMYSNAFSKGSLGLSIFLMVLMLHPIVAFPIAVCSKFLGKLCGCFFIKEDDIDIETSNSFCTKLKKRFLTCTMVLYLGFIAINQIYVNYMWTIFRNDEVKSCEATYNTTIAECEKAFVSRNDFSSKKYDQCNCNPYDKYSCVNTDNKQENIIQMLEIFKTDRSSTSDIVQYKMLGNVVFSILFHLFEVLLFSLPPISMFDFLYVPSLEKEAKIQQHFKGLSVVNDGLFTRPLKKDPNVPSIPFPRASSCTKNTICAITVILFFGIIHSSGFLYQYFPDGVLYEFQFDCPDKFYDSHPDPNFFKCEGKIK